MLTKAFSLITGAIFGLLLMSDPASACSLSATNTTEVKQALAQGIADKLGWNLSEVSLSDISTPELQMPLGLGADCSGLNAMHHTAGFRVSDKACTYEGVAVLMGYWYDSPVAVNYSKNCP